MRQPEWHDEVRLDTRVYGPWRSIHTARVYGEAGIHGYSIHTALVCGPCLRAADTVYVDRAPVNMALCLGSGRTRYDTIRDASLTCAQKPTQVCLIYRTEPTTKKWRKRKCKKRICLEIDKQSGESVESVLKKKRRATVGRIRRTGRFKPGVKRTIRDAILTCAQNLT